MTLYASLDTMQTGIPAMNKFSKALKEWGQSEFSRWLLPDGQFLGVPDYEDHRIIGIYCKDSWLEFVRDGACSLHFDSKCGYLWIRTGGLSFRQNQAFKNAFEELEIEVRELKIDFYDGTELQEVIEINGELAKLYLTDPIAYRTEKPQEEYYEEN